MASAALEAFEAQLGSVSQLIQIHQKLQTGPGRRHEQDAIHRAGVVITVAAWQAYIEKVLEEGLHAIENDINDPATAAPNWAKHSFRMRHASLTSTIKKFNTPNAVNVRDLLVEALDFNPWQDWEWRNRRRQWNAKEVRLRTDIWVRVRHSVAHGFPLPSDVVWLQAPGGRPRLTLGLLRECRDHFTHLATKTDAAFARHLERHHNLQQAW